MTWQTPAGTLLVFFKSETTLFYTKAAYWELSIISDAAASHCAQPGWWEAKGVLKGHNPFAESPASRVLPVLEMMGMGCAGPVGGDISSPSAPSCVWQMGQAPSAIWPWGIHKGRVRSLD